MLLNGSIHSFHGLTIPTKLHDDEVSFISRFSPDESFVLPLQEQRQAAAGAEGAVVAAAAGER